jgi:hypothetical protein
LHVDDEEDVVGSDLHLWSELLKEFFIYRFDFNGLFNATSDVVPDH